MSIYRAMNAVTLAAGTLALSACNTLTSVDSPDVVQPEDYATAGGASALAAGGMTRFNQMLGGDGFGYSYIIQSGELADELFVTGLNQGGAADWDGRNGSDPSLGGADPYNKIHMVRISLLGPIGAFQAASPDSVARIGQLFALVGFTELFLGENFCSGVPLSALDTDFRPIYGEPLTTQEMFERAAADFDSALVYGADSARITSLAAIGKGRALLNLARFGEAAQAVAGVPTDYAYNALFMTGRLENTTHSGGFTNRYTVPEQEGINGLNWRTAGDPRVQLINQSPGLMGIDGVTEVWAFVPYLEADSPIPVARGVEARLIEAEAALQTGDPTSWLAILNALRTTVPDLNPLTDPGSDDARINLHFRERAFWLFLTGHRQGDLRRLVRQYGRDPESVYPTGAWRDGLSYGSVTNMAPGGTAFNNPNYHGCLDRNP